MPAVRSGFSFYRPVGEKATFKEKKVPTEPGLQTERTGFEPAEPLRAHGFSKPAHSTTLPPLLKLMLFHL